MTDTKYFHGFGNEHHSEAIPTLISLLRGWYLETVFRLCPLFGEEDVGWQEHRWVTFRPGESVREYGQSGPLYVIVTGFASLSLGSSSDDLPLGYLCPGDLCGEIDPSPVTIVARSTVTAIAVDRERLEELSDEGKTAYDAGAWLLASGATA